MANIDTSKIENFDKMTPEEQVKALLGIEIPDMPDMSQFVSKKTFDDKATEAANLSKQLKAKLSDDEKAKIAETEAKEAEAKKYAELEEKYNEILKKSVVADNKAKFLALGYDEKLAGEAAQAMADGDTAKVFEVQQKFQEGYAKKVEADLMNKTPKPGGSGANDKPMSKEEIFKISDPVERQEAIAANMNLFEGQ